MLQIVIFLAVWRTQIGSLIGFPFDTGTEHERVYSTDLNVSLVKSLLDASVEVI